MAQFRIVREVAVSEAIMSGNTEDHKFEVPKLFGMVI
jgi:hypothetical protein